MSAHPTAVLLALHGAIPMEFALDDIPRGTPCWRILSGDHRRVLWYLPTCSTWMLGTALPHGAYREVAWVDIPPSLLDLLPQRTLDQFIS